MSGSRGGVSVVVSATDRATKTIDAINRKLDAMQRPTRALQRQLTKFGELSGLTRLNQGFQSLSKFALNSFQSMSKILGPLSAITGALSVAGLARLVTNFADFGSQLGFTSKRIGMVPGQLQKMQGAALLAGTSTQTLTTGMGALGQAMVDGLAGRNTDFVLGMNSLGISMRDSSGKAKKAADVFPDIQNRISALKDPFLQLRAATYIFGGAAEDMLPILRMNSAEFSKLTVEAAKYGGTMTEDDIKRANDFRIAQAELGLSVSSLANRIASELSPALTPLLVQLADFIAAQANNPNSQLMRMVNALANAIKSVNWQQVGTSIMNIATSVNNTVQAMGGWQHLIEGFIALKLASWATGTILPFVQMGAAIAQTSLAAGSLLNLLAKIPGSGVAAVVAAEVAGATIALTGAGIGNNDNNPQGRFRVPRPGGSWGYAGPKMPGVDQDIAAKQVIGMLVGMGEDPKTAAAMAAQMSREAGFNPRAVGDNGSAVGIGQWHPDRQARIKQKFGKSLQDMNLGEQVRAYDWEMRAYGPRIPSGYSAGQRGSLLSTDFERPADRDGEAASRSALATHFAALGAPLTIGGGTGASSAAQAVTVNGQAGVNINLRGAPPGTTVTSSAEGDMFSGAPRVNLAMEGVGP